MSEDIFNYRDLYAGGDAFEDEITQWIFDRFYDNDWFYSCSSWREGILISINLLYVAKSGDKKRIARLISNDDYTAMENLGSYYNEISSRIMNNNRFIAIMNRLSNDIGEKFDPAKVYEREGVEFYEIGNLSSYDDRKVWKICEVWSGGAKINVCICFKTPVEIDLTCALTGGDNVHAGANYGTVAGAFHHNCNPVGGNAYLTNRHVFNRIIAGERVYTRYEVDYIGTYCRGMCENFTWSGVEYFVDACLIDCRQSFGVVKGNIARQLSIRGIARPVGGLRVKKYGASSGLTVGEIVESKVKSKDLHGKANVIVVNGPRGFQISGDSGSLLLDMSDNAVGLLYGANLSGNVAVACDFRAVAAAMRISL